jgi:glutamate formiminotransferase
LGSEIVGLVPQAALDRAASHFLQLENYSPDLVLENRIAAALERKARGRAVEVEDPPG